MSIERDPSPSLLAEYTAAMAQERAEWKLLSDTGLSAVERVKAYGRWVGAAEHTKALSVKLGDDPAPRPCPP